MSSLKCIPIVYNGMSVSQIMYYLPGDASEIWDYREVERCDLIDILHSREDNFGRHIVG